MRHAVIPGFTDVLSHGLDVAFTSHGAEPGAGQGASMSKKDKQALVEAGKLVLHDCDVDQIALRGNIEIQGVCHMWTGSVLSRSCIPAGVTVELHPGSTLSEAGLPLRPTGRIVLGDEAVLRRLYVNAGEPLDTAGARRPRNTDKPEYTVELGTDAWVDELSVHSALRHRYVDTTDVYIGESSLVRNLAVRNSYKARIGADSRILGVELDGLNLELGPNAAMRYSKATVEPPEYVALMDMPDVIIGSGFRLRDSDIRLHNRVASGPLVVIGDDVCIHAEPVLVCKEHDPAARRPGMPLIRLGNHVCVRASSGFSGFPIAQFVAKDNSTIHTMNGDWIPNSTINPGDIKAARRLAEVEPDKPPLLRDRIAGCIRPETITVGEGSVLAVLPVSYAEAKYIRCVEVADGAIFYI